MDHDDYLFPDALRRMWEFAEANDLDVVHAKEVVDGWSTPAWLAFRTQIPRGYDRYTFDDITPHKLYRRSFLIDQEVWFREGRVRLEDIDFNVRAWMRTDAIGVMADYPVYKWILHVDNSHKKGSPTYWEDLKLAVQPLHDECTDGQKRSFILARIYRRQILDRLGPGLLERSEEARTQLAVDLRDQLPHFPEEVDARLDPPRRARSALLRRGDWTGLMDLARADLGLMLFTTSVSFDWVDSQLELVRRRRHRRRAGDSHDRACRWGPGSSDTSPLSWQSAFATVSWTSPTIWPVRTWSVWCDPDGTGSTGRSRA